LLSYFAQHISSATDLLEGLLTRSVHLNKSGLLVGEAGLHSLGAGVQVAVVGRAVALSELAAAAGVVRLAVAPGGRLLLRASHSVGQENEMEHD